MKFSKFLIKWFKNLSLNKSLWRSQNLYQHNRKSGSTNSKKEIATLMWKFIIKGKLLNSRKLILQFNNEIWNVHIFINYNKFFFF